ARRHSQELEKHAQVAAAIMIKPDMPVVGMQIEGEAVRVTDQAELEVGVRVYDDRYQHDPDFYKDFTAGRREHKLYRLTPRSITLFSELDFPGTPQQVWQPAGAQSPLA
ncbi:MAG: hypothetical protein ACR2FM_00500, partial [Candidatus Saccharimonadales bacterium]